MTVEEIIAVMEKELADLKAKQKAEKIKDADKPWPRTDDTYLTIQSGCEVKEDVWWGLGYDHDRKSIGNVFRSEEEARRAVLRLKARKKFLDHGGHEGLDGYRGQRPWYVYPQDGCIELMIGRAGGIDAFTIWFDTQEAAREAVKNLTSDEVAALCWNGGE